MAIKELQIISKTISPIIDKALALNIKDSKTLELASDFRSSLKAEEKRLENDKQSLTKPINESLKAIRAKYAPAEDIITQALNLLNGKMSEYQMDLLKKQREEEQKIADKVSSGYIKLETASKKIGELAPIEAPLKTSFRTDHILQIFAVDFIPREYMNPIESLIIKDLKAGKQIPGARLMEFLTPVNNRKQNE